MKHLALILLSALFTLPALAQERQDGSLNLVSGEETEAMVFESEVIDYGTIEQGSDGVRVFVFTNQSNAPLIIDRCKGSCGCTVPQCPKEAILPGESGEIEVRYDTNRIGSFTKNVTVTYNGGETKRVKIKGKITPKEG